MKTSCRLSNRSVRQAKLGLIAMLLLTLGPLISQLTAPEKSSGMMSSMTQMIVSNSDHGGMDHDHAKTEHDSMGHDHTKMDHAWYDQCGYCSLAFNFPFIFSSLPDVIRDTPQATEAVVKFVRSAFRPNTIFLLALKRAPPHLRS